ncbi:MAG: 1-acyl-sn-glycerol-3-phosphate acyltransferase [Halieaceae bacterium]|nr:1-acyl-sn-glycerol-3-phosphate acyltransferase [Halieaceae bacterium]
MSLYTVYKYVIYIPWLLLWTLVNFLGVVLVAPFSQQRASRWFGGMWGRGLLRAVPARLRIVGERDFDRRQPYIVVSNHLSLMDIPILYGWLDLDLKWVMKKELRKVPMIGGGCAMLGHIFLDRGNHQAAVEELQQVKDRLLPGTSILFFPEGTRSRSGELQAFKLGAFRMARDIDLPILPITLKGADRILPPDNIQLRPGTATMIIHPPIPVEEVRANEPEALRDLARAIIAAGLD